VSLVGDRIPWEDGAVPFPANLGLTWWECLVSPTRFFERVEWEGSFSRPLLYFLITAIVASLLGLFWFAWGPWIGAGGFGLPLEVQLLSFFITPFAVLAGLAAMTLVQHLFVLMLAPGRRRLGATGRVLCYASGIGLVTGAVPPAIGPAGPMPGVAGLLYLLLYLALVIAVEAWYVVVMVLGIRQAHDVSTGRAAAIVLLPIAVGLFLTGVLVFVAIALTALAELPV
jgi:hypothetical protein